MGEPNLESIVIANAIGLILLISLMVTGYMTRERRRLVDRMFAAMVIICAGACIFEPITWFVDGHVEPWAFALNYLGNTYCYLATPFTAYFWVLYVDLRLHRGTNHIERYYPVLLVCCIIAGIAVIGNLFGHYLFVIDEHNVYSRLPLSYLNYVILFAMLIFSVWLKFKYQREHHPIRFFPMSMFLVPIFVGSGLQAAIFGVSLAWPSVCVGLTSIHMSQQNELSYIDSLTGLYNRTYMDSVLKSMERRGKLKAGVMVDLDFFKQINDVYGHSMGDRALAQVAGVLTSYAPYGAEVVRMAGDEFIVLFNAENDGEIEKAKDHIRDGIDEFNASSDEPYELSLSLGGCLFVESESDDAVDAFLRNLDARMYVEKRQRHAQAAIAQ